MDYYRRNPDLHQQEETRIEIKKGKDNKKNQERIAEYKSELEKTFQVRFS